MYHHLNIRPKDITKMTFRNRYVNYEFLIMSFGLTNVHIDLMSFKNGVSKPFFYSFVIVFIDSILVYMKSEKECANHHWETQVICKKFPSVYCC